MSKKIIIISPIEVKWLNETRSIYLKIFKSLLNSEILNVDNYKSFVFPKNYICIYFPIFYAGFSKLSYNLTFKRVKRYWLVDNFPTYNEFHNYTNLSLKVISQSNSSIAYLHEYDMHDYATSDFKKDIVDFYNSYLLTPGSELFDFEFCQNISKPDIPIKINESVNNFLKDQRKRIISLTHVIDLQDQKNMIFKKKRFLKYACIGAMYYLRREFMLILLKRNYLLGFVISIFFLVNYKISSKILPLKYRLSWLKLFQKKLLNNVYYCFICGSTSGHFVRKYLEVPLSGSIIISPPYLFMKRLGFIENYHYKPYPIEQKMLNRLGNNKDENIPYIRKNCFELISELHSFQARLNQLNESLDLIASNNFNGSYWENGEYKHYSQ